MFKYIVREYFSIMCNPGSRLNKRGPSFVTNHRKNLHLSLYRVTCENVNNCMLSYIKAGYS